MRRCLSKREKSLTCARIARQVSYFLSGMFVPRNQMITQCVSKRSSSLKRRRDGHLIFELYRPMILSLSDYFPYFRLSGRLPVSRVHAVRVQNLYSRRVLPLSGPRMGLRPRGRPPRRQPRLRQAEGEGRVEGAMPRNLPQGLVEEEEEEPGPVHLQVSNQGGNASSYKLRMHFSLSPSSRSVTYNRRTGECELSDLDRRTTTSVSASAAAAERASAKRGGERGELIVRRHAIQRC